jgi:hypothetical protein
MKKLFLLLTGAIVAGSMSFAGLPVSLTINKTTKGVTPDGIVDSKDDWKTNWVACTAQKTSNTTTAITSSKFQMTYNDTYLWVVLQSDGDATVDTLGTAIPNTYERDDYELFVKTDTASVWADGKYHAGDWQFRERRGSIFPDGFEAMSAAWRDTVLKNTTFKLGQVDAGSSYVQEWQMPWNMLKMTDTVPFSPGKGGYLKFECQNADNTTGTASGRTQQVFWKNASDNQWDNTRDFELVYLSTPVGVRTAASVENQVDLVNSLVTNGQLQLTTAASGKLFNIQGQAVGTFTNTNVIKLKLNSGVYFAKFNGQNESKRFVVR